MRKMPGCLEEPVLDLIFIKMMVSTKEKFFIPPRRRFFKGLVQIGNFCSTISIGTSKDTLYKKTYSRNKLWYFNIIIFSDISWNEQFTIIYSCLGKQTKHVQMMVIQLWRASLFLSLNDNLITQTKPTNTNTSGKPHAY